MPECPGEVVLEVSESRQSPVTAGAQEGTVNTTASLWDIYLDLLKLTSYFEMFNGVVEESGVTEWCQCLLECLLAT